MSHKTALPPLLREDRGHVTVLRFESPTLRSDQSTHDLFDHIYTLVETDGRSHLALNFDQVDFISSAVLGKLVGLMRRTRSAGGNVVVCKPKRAIEELFQVTRLADVLPCCQDEHDAIKLLQA